MMFAVGVISFGAGAADTLPEELTQTLQEYRKSKGLILEVRKTIKNTMLEKETTFKGEIQFAQGKFYWETSEPERNLLVYDGSLLWNVQYPPAEFKKMPLQVAKMSLKSKKNSPLIIVDIFGQRPLEEVFQVTAKGKVGDLSSFELKEKKTDLGLKNLTLKVDSKQRRVVALEYLDEVDNETKLEFVGTQLNAKVKQTIFKYKPPANAKVTEY